jgi:hypothetical protein
MLERLTATQAMLGFTAMMLVIAVIATLSPSLRRPPPFPDTAVDPARAEDTAGGPTAEGPPGGIASRS